jgi:hypothetical protein
MSSSVSHVLDLKNPHLSSSQQEVHCFQFSPISQKRKQSLNPKMILVFAYNHYESSSPQIVQCFKKPKPNNLQKRPTAGSSLLTNPKKPTSKSPNPTC